MGWVPVKDAAKSPSRAVGPEFTTHSVQYIIYYVRNLCGYCTVLYTVKLQAPALCLASRVPLAYALERRGEGVIKGETLRTRTSATALEFSSGP